MSYVVALDGKDGSEIWRYATSMQTGDLAIFNPETTILWAGSTSILAFNALSGEVLWTFPAFPDDPSVRHTTALAIGNFIAGTAELEIVYSVWIKGNGPKLGNVFMLDSKGKLIWSINLQVFDPTKERGVTYLVALALIARDITGDGSMELVIGSDECRVLVYDFS